VSGLEGSGIDVAAVVEGRPATVIGIVHRPYPTATDRRFAVLPRMPADLAVGPAETASSSGGGSGGRTPSGRTGSAGGSTAGSASASSGTMPAPTIDFAALAEHEGEVVTVGGLVVEVAGSSLRVDDGTAIGRVELRGEAAAYLVLVEAGDAISVSGRVERIDGSLAVAVEDPAGISRVGETGIATADEAAAAAAASAGPALVPRPAPAHGGDAAAGGGALPAILPAVLLTVGVVAGLSLLAAVRRRRAHRAQANHLADRLAAFVGPRPAPTTAPAAVPQATSPAAAGPEPVR
jgi:hypothetical protein